MGASEEDALASMCGSHALNAVDPRFAKIRVSERNSKLEAAQKKSSAPTAGAREKTRPLVDNAKIRKATLNEWARRTEGITPEDKSRALQLSKAMTNEARKNPAVAYDIAISLRFMNLPNQALEALRSAKQNAKALWLELDLLLETERFVEVLDKATQLEHNLSSDPDATLAAGYARAIALQGLGQAEDAIKLLERIVKSKPNYRSAHSLLMKWKGEEK